ncbi:MAG: SIR2 family protein [Clostridiaceae bacterium]|nr:SIR2 family protein [Clostridiaceae bacterium]
MDLKKAIKHALDGSAILFLGAGFSKGALNSQKENFLLASDLCDLLNTSMNIHVKHHDLGDVSERFVEEKGSEELANIIKKQYSCYSYTEEQKNIISLPWRRIYTTNYDDIVEKISEDLNNQRFPIVLSDDPIKYEKSNIVIHLNGSIKKFDKKDIKTSLNLTTHSYLASEFRNSKWHEFFSNDISGAGTVIFIGCSFDYDIDLQRILYGQMNLFKDKIIFIDKYEDLTSSSINNDPYKNSKKEKFGTIYNIGVTRFFKNITSIKESYTPTKLLKSLSCFKHINAIPTYPQDAPVNDLWKLLMYGNLNVDILSGNIGNNNYIIFRSEIERVIHELVNNDKKVVILSSEMGNGKTCFINSLSFILKNYGNVYYLNDFESSRIIDDIDIIESNSNSTDYIIIDNYTNYFEVIKILSKLKDFKFILTERTFVHDTNYTRLLNCIDVDINDISDIDLNPIALDDKEHMIKSLNTCGIFYSVNTKNNINSKYTSNNKKKKRNSGNTIKDILLDYGSKAFDERIGLINIEMNTYPDLKNILLCSFINNSFNLNLNLTEILTLMNIQQIPSSFKRNNLINEIISFANNEILLKSPILTEYLISKYNLKEALLDTMECMIHNCCNLINSDKSKVIHTSLNSASNIWHLLRKSYVKDSDSLKKKVLLYYDNIQKYYRDNHFFWLQYSIICTDLRYFDRSEMYINNAYEIVHDNFETYQLDTQLARIILEKGIFEDNIYTNPFEKFQEANYILKDNSHQSVNVESRYVVTDNYSKYYDKYCHLFTVEQDMIFRLECQGMYNKINDHLRKERNRISHNKRKYLENSIRALKRFINANMNIKVKNS